MNKLTFEDVYYNKYIHQSVKAIVNKLSRMYPILNSYADDIEEELWLHVNRSLSKYLPCGSASIESYIRKVIESRIHNVIKKYFSTSSVNSYNSCHNDFDEVFHLYAKNEIKLYDLRADLKYVFKKLNATQRQICYWIMDGHSCSDIAKKLEISESSFYFKHIYPIRKVFKQENLQKYLEIY